MLSVKETLAKLLSWYGLRFDWSEYGTNNTTDTWVPVFVDGKIQHRVIPTNLMRKSELVREIFDKDNVTVNANGICTAQTFNVAKSGYTPLMIQVHLSNASSSGTNVSGCCAFFQTLSGNTATVQVSNRFASAAKIKIWVTVLYKAN